MRELIGVRGGNKRSEQKDRKFEGPEASASTDQLGNCKLHG